MLWFIIGMLLVLVAIAIFAFGKTSTESFRAAGILPLVLAIPLIVVSMIAIVGPRNIGVEHVFNRTTGDNHGAGLVWKAPWVSVEDIDASIQPEEYKGDDGCIYVKIADGGRSCVTLSYRWRINPDHADEAFKDYNKGDGILPTVRSAVVSTNIKAAINEVLGTFDPLAGTEITPDMTAEQISNIKLVVVPDYVDLNAKIKENLESKIDDLGGLVDIQSVTISYMTTPDSTQERIDRIKNKVLETKESLIDIANKEAQAKGNEALAASLQDPNVIVSKCMDSLASGDIEGFAGFQCWPGTGGSLVLPSAK